MDGQRSLQSLLEFLDYLRNKGLMNQTTATARKVAASAVFGVLEDGEKVDVTSVDLDHAMLRFQNLQGKSYTPGSLRTYQGRVRAAVDDFSRYLENPLAFKSSVQSRERKVNQAKSTQGSELRRPTETVATPTSQAAAGPMASSILPIPIRSDLTVFIQGLPFDLKESEAKKIASVVQAMASSV